MEEILNVQNLKTYFHTEHGVVHAVDGVSFRVERGEALGIAGETGSGKSVTVKSIMRNLPPYAECTADRIMLDGTDLRALSDQQMQGLLGKKIAMIFQNPASFINPLFTVGEQMSDVLRCHRKMTKAEAKARSLELLRMVGMPDPDAVLHQYPFQMSGGMIQRVMIAMGLSCDPSLLIADEPTTALDVTIQAQILQLLEDLKGKTGGLILITHNLAIIRDICDKMMVMYAGRTVEYGNVHRIMQTPMHPYTRGLIAAIPRLGTQDKKLSYIPGNIPNLIAPPTGCRFAPRCPYSGEICHRKQPDMKECGENHFVACYAVEGGELHE